MWIPCRVLLLCCLLLPFALSPAIAAEILSVTQDPDEPPRYDIIEISIEVDSTYENPCDPEEVRLWAEMESPAGEVVTAGGFWYEPHSRALDGGTEVFTPAGPGHWMIRFAPRLEGLYAYRIHVEDNEGHAASPVYSFRAGEAQSRGFIRVDLGNSRYFAYDDGTSCVPLGYNICWVNGASGGFRYVEYLDDLRAGGGNWTRLWMSHFGQGTTLEWGAYHPTGYYDGLGRYSQQVGAKLDAIFSHAQDAGVAIALVLHQHSQFEAIQWSSWEANPYNAVNGGPCATSADYLTDPEALRLSRNLHQYIIARYGAFRSVMAWEIWNEAEGILGVPIASMNQWSRDAADFFNSLDPAGHLVTTSYGSPVLLPGCDVESWDFNNRHQYILGSWLVGEFLKPYREAGSPLLLSEFGIDWWAELNDRDPLGVNIHNGTWSALMHGYAGGAMNWWWDSYVDPLDLWDLNRAPADFVAGEQMTGFTGDVPAVAFGAGRIMEIAAIGALEGNDDARLWLWLHDLRSNWSTPQENITPVEDAVAVLVTAAPESPRTWCAEVWNTWTGEVTGGFTVRQKGPVMILDIPAFTRDMAVKLTFHGGPELQSVTEDMRGLRQAEPVHDRGAGTWGSVHGPFR